MITATVRKTCRALGETLALIAFSGMGILSSAALMSGPGLAAVALTTNQLSDSVSVVDVDTMEVIASVAVSGKPAGIALSRDHRRAYVTAPDGASLFEIDIASRSLVRTLKVGKGPLGIATNPKRHEIYIADWYVHEVIVIDAASFKAVARIGVGQSPSGLAVSSDGTHLVSADRDSNQVSVINVETRQVVRRIAVGERPFGVTLSADGTTGFTANVASNDVTMFDVRSGHVAATFKVGRRPYAVALIGDRGFVTDQYTGTVSQFRVSDPAAKVSSVEVCDHPEGIEADSAGRFIYVSCWGDDALVKLDAGSLAVVGKAAVGVGPRGFGAFLP